MRLLLLGLSSTLILACVSSTDALSTQDTATQYKNWSALDQTYKVSFQQACFCTQDYLRPMRLIIRDNVIVGAHFEDDQSEVPDIIIADLLTIDAMFKIIVEAEALPAPSVVVEYDEKLAFPIKVEIDYDERMADDEIHWQLSNLILPGSS